MVEGGWISWGSCQCNVRVRGKDGVGWGMRELTIESTKRRLNEEIRVTVMGGYGYCVSHHGKPVWCTLLLLRLLLLLLLLFLLLLLLLLRPPDTTRWSWSTGSGNSDANNAFFLFFRGLLVKLSTVAPTPTAGAAGGSFD